MFVLVCFGSSCSFLFQATTLTPVAVDRLDDLDLYDDVSELDDDDMGELDESVAVGPSSGYSSPYLTLTRSSTGDCPSRSQIRSYSRYCLCGCFCFFLYLTP